MRTGLAIMSPLIPILKEDYQLSSFALSFLTSLSIVCFAGSAFLMPLVGRIGSTNRVIGTALLVLTGAMIIRAVGNVPLLYFSSLTIGITIAILNFSLPVWVKENVPRHSGLVTGIYITLMGGFANIAIAVAVPLATATSLGWRLSMVPWIVIGVFSSAWWFLRNAKMPSQTHVPEPAKFHRELLRKPGAWSIALFFGLQAMMGYGATTWMPTILVSKGFSLTDAGLWLSITGFAGSTFGIVAPYYGSKLKDFRILLSTIALILTISMTAFTLDSGWHLIVWLLISNFGFAFAFPLCLVLTVTRSVEAGETRSLSIMTQSVGYSMAAFSPGIVALIFDISNNWNTALLFTIGIGVILIGVGYKAGSPEKIVI
ncbi:MAG: MFS transporter [Actinobacteria bacterium]|nr:MFS transporter [Actinomycetota bacterium]